MLDTSFSVPPLSDGICNGLSRFIGEYKLGINSWFECLFMVFERVCPFTPSISNLESEVHVSFIVLDWLPPHSLVWALVPRNVFDEFFEEWGAAGPQRAAHKPRLPHSFGLLLAMLFLIQIVIHSLAGRLSFVRGRPQTRRTASKTAALASPDKPRTCFMRSLASVPMSSLEARRRVMTTQWLCSGFSDKELALAEACWSFIPSWQIGQARLLKTWAESERPRDKEDGVVQAIIPPHGVRIGQGPGWGGGGGGRRRLRWRGWEGGRPQAEAGLKSCSWICF